MSISETFAAPSSPQGSDDPVLIVDKLSVHYNTPSGPVKAVNSVSFSLNRGERFGLIGESGSGKTTMATALMRLTSSPGRIVGGRVLLDGKDLLSMNQSNLRAARLRDISQMPQGAMSSLSPVMRIKDQIIDGILAHEPKTLRVALDDRVAKMLTRVGLDPSIARKYPHQLSGGMKQRVVMAIATSLQPKVIVADEPTSALDVVVQRQIMQTLGRLQEGNSAAVVLIGHDMGLMAQFADKIGVMYAGKLVEVGATAEVIKSPRHPYTRRLIESIPTIDVKKSLTGIPGLPPSLVDLPKGCSFSSRCAYSFDRCLNERPQLQDIGTGRQVACHFYPEYEALPPLPANSQQETLA
jgi:peptide/nickel transport system ATP-binding protein